MPAPFYLGCGGAAEVIHAHALAGVGLVVAFEYAVRQFNVAHKAVVNCHALGAVLAGSLCLIHVDPVDQLPQQRCGQRVHLHELPNS